LTQLRSEAHGQDGFAGCLQADEAGAEWMRLANDSEGIAQNIDGFIRRQNRLATIRHKSEKEGAAGNDGASIVLGECRVALS
ncbi:hypothetical protein, partial [Zoogloea sp.]|uniref:hypothetical protein n=1 Tax=Zoogloea sp. TaxID=49181 RepID=UPI00261B17A7